MCYTHFINGLTKENKNFGREIFRSTCAIYIYPYVVKRTARTPPKHWVDNPEDTCVIPMWKMVEKTTKTKKIVETSWNYVCFSPSKKRDREQANQKFGQENLELKCAIECKKWWYSMTPIYSHEDRWEKAKQKLTRKYKNVRCGLWVSTSFGDESAFTVAGPRHSWPHGTNVPPTSPPTVTWGTLKSHDNPRCTVMIAYYYFSL